MSMNPEAGPDQEDAPRPGRRYLIGISTKMYFSHTETLSWCREIAAVCDRHPATRSGAASVFVLPGFLSLVEAVRLLPAVGAQDASWASAGAYTGEVSPSEVAEIGGRYVAVGHAERRRLFKEDDDVVAAKTAAALHHGLIPVLCVGEVAPSTAEEAIVTCLNQVGSALPSHRDGDVIAEVVVAYEPVWAIGAQQPASVGHIRAVCRGLQGRLAGSTDSNVSLLYGGSAGPGLLREIGDDVDGLFLGRLAHDPAGLAAVLDDVTAIGLESGRSAPR